MLRGPEFTSEFVQFLPWLSRIATKILQLVAIYKHELLSLTSTRDMANVVLIRHVVITLIVSFVGLS